MSRPVPVELARLRGNPGHRPLRQGPRSPRAEDVPDPPAYLHDEFGREEWTRLAPGLFALGLLTDFDITAFAIHCANYGRWRRCEQMLSEAMERDPAAAQILAGPLLKITSAAARDVLRTAAEFGFTPSARSRVTATDYSPNKFAGLLA